MSVARTRLLALLLVVIQISTMSFVQMRHVHNLSAGTIPFQQIRSHDCGDTERHLPVDSDTNCILCQRITQFVTTINDGTPAPTVRARLLTNLERSYHRSQETDFYSFKRGPPVLG